MSTPDREHAWAESRFAAYTSGLLDDTSRARMERHVATCAECQAEVAAAREDGADPGHLPGPMMRRWPEQQGRLRGLQRHLVRVHLEGCESCRSMIRFFGYEPVMAQVPGLEAGSNVLAAIALDRDEERAIPPTPIAQWPSLPRGTLAAWAGIATAAAAALLLFPGLAIRHPAPPTVSRPAGPSLALLGGLESLEPQLRAGGPTPNVIEIDSLSRSVTLPAHAIQGLPDVTAVEVELLDSAGAVLFGATHTQAGIRSKRSWVMNEAGAPLRPGEYELRLRSLPLPGPGSAPADTERYRFVLRLSASPPRR